MLVSSFSSETRHVNRSIATTTAIQLPLIAVADAQRAAIAVDPALQPGTQESSSDAE